MVVLGYRPSQELLHVKGSGQELIPYFTNGQPDELDFGEVQFVPGDHEATGKSAIVLAVQNPEENDPLRKTLRVYGICACVIKGRKDFTVINRPESLAPQQVDIIKIVFHPARSGIRSGLLRITCSDPENPDRKITLVGKALKQVEDEEAAEEADKAAEAETVGSSDTKTDTPTESKTSR
jgi:hypothetical protein